MKDFLLLITVPLINIIFGYFSDKRQFAKEKYLDNKKKIDTAYEEIFNSLLKLRKYYYLFVESGNEFKTSKNWKEFSPLNIITEFFNDVEDREIFLDENFMKEFEKLKNKISIHPSMALSMNLNFESYFESLVEDEAKRTLEAIDTFKEFMKKRFNEKL